MIKSSNGLKEVRTMKILNAFAGAGGNRYLWDELASDLELEFQITAIEKNPEMASAYSRMFSHDVVLVGDAWEYMKHHMNDHDVIWASVPCPTHTKFRLVNYGKTGKIFYPDMTGLYGLIIILQQFFKGKFVVENVVPYYEPLMNPVKIGRHLFWSNQKLFNGVNVPEVKTAYSQSHGGTENYRKFMCEYLGFEVPRVNLKDLNGRLRADTVLRNCVHPVVGKYVLKQLIQPEKTIVDFCTSNV